MKRTLYVAPLERQCGAHMSNYANGDVPEANIDTDVADLMASQSSDSTQAGMPARGLVVVSSCHCGGSADYVVVGINLSHPQNPAQIVYPPL